jgi:predicted nucleic acid-binding protein
LDWEPLFAGALRRLVGSSLSLCHEDRCVHRRGRILPFDERAAGHFADIAAKWTKLGRLVASFDPQIAAIARAHDMTVVTRNVRHFEDCDVPIINPWSL